VVQPESDRLPRNPGGPAHTGIAGPLVNVQTAKVLKRDMTALFGVRRVLELEQTFLYLCMHDGSLLDIPELFKALEVKKATANSFIALLESTHLIHRLPPFGYGKEVLRARYEVYLADAAIAPSVMLKGKSLLEDAPALGVAVETAFFNHILTVDNNVI
jgi:hypothetical protein